MGGALLVFVLTFMALVDAGLLVCLDWPGENAPREVAEHLAWWVLLYPGFLGGLLGVSLRRLLKKEDSFANRPDSTGVSRTSTVAAELRSGVGLGPAHGASANYRVGGVGGEWAKLGAFAGLTVLAVVLIVRGGVLILPERQRWNWPG